MIDSKTVNKAIREELRPFLKEVGFSQFTGKGAWRYTDIKIDVIILESFNAYNAAVQGCTTFSFQVEIGCYFPWIPHWVGSVRRKRDDILLPHYADCLFSRAILKTLSQPEFDNKYIWYIGYNGEYLKDSLLDVKTLLKSEGLTWFDQFNSPQAVMDKLEAWRLSEAQNPRWDYGNKPSPHWCYHAGYAALWLKDYKLALKYLKLIENYEFLDAVHQRIIKDIKTIEEQIKVT